MTYDSQARQSGRIPVQFVEIDMDYCGNTYGSAPCTAAVGVTGARKCFNTYATCQDKAHYTRTLKTYRFCSKNAALPVGVQAWPLLAAVTFAPQQITPGKGLGVRASVSVKLVDMPFHDHGVDPYVAERPYRPEEQGTFWGKFRARNPFYPSRFLRVLSGYVGSPFSWDDFTTREYVIDTFKGPNRAGEVDITAKDVLKLADDKTAMCPVANTGTLNAAITTTSGSATLAPAGIGDLEYPASGRVVISGEGMEFTRVGDVLTLTTRDVYGLGAKAHAVGDTAQVVKRYTDAEIQDVIYDLLTNYGAVPTTYIDKPAWDAERDSFLPGVWSTDICEPTGVNTLLAELTEQGLCDIWCDEIAQQVRFQALRPPAVGLTVLSDESHFLNGSVTPSDDQTQRISRMLVYFGRIDPTRKLDETGNYKTRFGEAELESEGDNEYGTSSIKTIYSRWFSTFSLGRVETLVETLLKRFSHPPRILDYKVDASSAQRAGDLFYASTRNMQDETGARALVNMMVVQAKEDQAGTTFTCRAQENVYNDRIAGSGSLVVISADGFNLDLYAIYVSEFGVPSAPVTVQFSVLTGVLIGSHSATLPALLNSTAWPAGSAITLVNAGTIKGMGGQGGAGGQGGGTDESLTGSEIPTVAPPGSDMHGRPGATGHAGGTALKADYALTVVNTGGTIAGGGGGNGGGGGAGAAMHNFGGYKWPGSPGGGGGGGAGVDAGAGGPATTNSDIVYLTSNPGGAGSATAGGAGGHGATPLVNPYAGVMGQGGTGGSGGALGSAGVAGAAGGNGNGFEYGLGAAGGAGGAAGKAVDGDSHITWVATGTRIGPIV